MLNRDREMADSDVRRLQLLQDAAWRCASTSDTQWQRLIPWRRIHTRRRAGRPATSHNTTVSVSLTPQPYQKIPDIYFLRCCTLQNFIGIPSPITIQFVVDVFFVLYVILYFLLYCLLCYLVLGPQSWINSTTTTTTTTTITTLTAATFSFSFQLAFYSGVSMRWAGSPKRKRLGIGLIEGCLHRPDACPRSSCQTNTVKALKATQSTARRPTHWTTGSHPLQTLQERDAAFLRRGFPAPTLIG